MSGLCSPECALSCGSRRCGATSRRICAWMCSLVFGFARCAGCGRDSQLPRNDLRRRSAAWKGDELRRRRRGVHRHDAPAVLPHDASAAARRRDDAVLRRRALHRTHNCSQRSDPQLHRTGGPTNFPPSGWLVRVSVPARHALRPQYTASSACLFMCRLVV